MHGVLLGMHGVLWGVHGVLWGALDVLCGVCMVCRGVQVCMVCCAWCTVGTHKKMASVRSEHKLGCPRYSTKLSVTQEAPVQDWYTSAIRKTMKWTASDVSKPTWRSYRLLRPIVHKLSASSIAFPHHLCICKDETKS